MSFPDWSHHEQYFGQPRNADPDTDIPDQTSYSGDHHIVPLLENSQYFGIGQTGRAYTDVSSLAFQPFPQIAAMDQSYMPANNSAFFPSGCYTPDLHLPVQSEGLTNFAGASTVYSSNTTSYPLPAAMPGTIENIYHEAGSNNLSDNTQPLSEKETQYEQAVPRNKPMVQTAIRISRKPKSRTKPWKPELFDPSTCSNEEVDDTQIARPPINSSTTGLKFPTESKANTCMAKYNPASWCQTYNRGSRIVIPEELLARVKSLGGVCTAGDLDNKEAEDSAATNDGQTLYLPSISCSKSSCLSAATCINNMVIKEPHTDSYIHSMTASCLDVSHVTKGYHPIPICSYKGRQTGQQKYTVDQSCIRFATRVKTHLPYCNLHFGMLRSVPSVKKDSKKLDSEKGSQRKGMEPEMGGAKRSTRRGRQNELRLNTVERSEQVLGSPDVSSGVQASTSQFEYPSYLLHVDEDELPRYMDSM
jgi:hypothetical protein